VTKRAWRVTFDSTDGIVAAETRGKAHAAAWRTVKELYYKPKWGSIRVRRAPEHDAWAGVDSTGVCWNENLLPGGKYGHRQPACRKPMDYESLKFVLPE
jgi:hypothetical protein